MSASTTNTKHIQEEETEGTHSEADSSPDSRKRSLPDAKRRPYRRTKRPAGYNDKSSITTTTNVLWQQPLNVFDSILAESQDLLQAATEAQQLGRYKIAATYLILLHTRLVGLGKRFDKIKMTPRSSHPQQHPNSSSNNNNNWEVDTAMMEHLARAAAELHAARKWDTAASPGDITADRSPLQSPDARTFLAFTANQQGVTNAATVTGVAQSEVAWGVAAVEPTAAGRKPVTTAMNTVPYANCNMRALLRGGPITAGVESLTLKKDEEGAGE